MRWPLTDHDWPSCSWDSTHIIIGRWIKTWMCITWVSWSNINSYFAKDWQKLWCSIKPITTTEEKEWNNSISSSKFSGSILIEINNVDCFRGNRFEEPIRPAFTYNEELELWTIYNDKELIKAIVQMCPRLSVQTWEWHRDSSSNVRLLANCSTAIRLVPLFTLCNRVNWIQATTERTISKERFLFC